MKNLTIIPVLVAIFVWLFTAVCLGNDDKYITAMKKNISLVYEGKTIEEIQGGVNALERIALAEKSKWEPYYYAAFGQIMMANRETVASKKDAYLDLAIENIKKATDLKGDASEVTALEGFVHMIRVTVDPGSRGQLYSGMAFESFSKAVDLNPENPRALSLLAQMQYGTAQFFGSPVTEACATAKSALEKFQSFKSENPLAPVWGKGMTEGLKAKCQ
jgi:tetratricopeptide (TPR) repeat protein